ncbi:dihydrofolate reductase family protein [Sphingomonas morindae]|uniref:Dihydrofolate reductase family protein n=1 Tax=Sphingomonas morindae TaxID=1541170 RepID=A0ABY4X5P2_9SPHN|nr:dihydrofolate reductase family protein [Sphingomonas morindae]USI72218.1 dihydrofolate reductase family protein [Sphingomonas morindae]
MRPLILKMTMSLDGFVADAGGETGWMFGSDPEPKAWGAALVATAGLHLMGSRTFEAMARWWPGADGPFAAPMNAIPKAVFSRRAAAMRAAAAPGAESGNWASAAILEGDLAPEVARLKAADGAPLLAHGGARFGRSLVTEGLVDRLVLLVVPVALGRGAALFADLPAPRRFTLLESRAFPGGAVAQTYAPATP